MLKQDAIKIAWGKIEGDASLKEAFVCLFIFASDLEVCNEGIEMAYWKITKYAFRSHTGWKFKYIMDRAKDKAGDTGNFAFRAKLGLLGKDGKKLKGDALAKAMKELYKEDVEEAKKTLEEEGIDKLIKRQMAAILHCEYDVYYNFNTPTANKLRRELTEKLSLRPLNRGDDSSMAASSPDSGGSSESTDGQTEAATASQ